ncbi:hypothetical protein G6F37_004162 [Rhizopus arrhizus]|nr:hypothetical protein G6F38_004678 [Rhizopus arrhizus]KAG1160259.1 hypothetical protein G6F37_004162 [Rhizopus arrhizus]
MENKVTLPPLRYVVQNLFQNENVPKYSSPFPTHTFSPAPPPPPPPSSSSDAIFMQPSAMIDTTCCYCCCYPVNQQKQHRRSNSAEFPIIPPQTFRRARAHTTSGYPTKEEPRRRYHCHLCRKSFLRPSSLKTHNYSHTGEKPFRCPYVGCDRSFSVHSNMRRHLRTHDESCQQ